MFQPSFTIKPTIMKTIFVLYFALLTLGLAAQDFPKNADGKIEFQEVVDVPELSPEEVAKRTVAWALSYWATPTIASQTKDRVVIKVSSNSKRSAMHTYELKYNLIVEGKDGKYRFTLSDFQILEVGLMTYPLEKRIKKKQVQEFAWEDIQALIASLKDGIANGVVDVTKEQW